MRTANRLLLTSSITAPPAGPALDATGTSGTTTSGGGTTCSGTHAAAASATVLAFIKTSGTTALSSVLYAGTATSLVGSIPLNNVASSGTLWLYRLAGAPAGTQTIAVTSAASNIMCFGTISYTGVTTVGTPSTAFGTGTAPSQALTCSASQIIVEAIASAGNISVVSGATNRALVFQNTIAGSGNRIAISDSAASATFAATTASGAWAALGVVLS